MASQQQQQQQQQPQQPLTLGDHKESIIKNLEVMLENVRQEKEFFRMRAYQTALTNIKAHLGPIRTLADIKGIAGIGDKTKQRIKEIIETGLLDEAEKIRDERGDELQVLEELSKVYGIGSVKAQELFKQGVISVSDLRQKNHQQVLEEKVSAKTDKAVKALLNGPQRLGLAYYDDFLERIPRSEMERHREIFTAAMQKAYPQGVDFEIVGSYRRQAVESGDIDILIKDRDHLNQPLNLKIIVGVLKTAGYVQETLANGSKKFMGVCRVDTHSTHRRLDLLVTPAAEWPFALLYFTGSQALNIKMRALALLKGFSLNEHCLSNMVVSEVEVERKLKDGSVKLYKRKVRAKGDCATIKIDTERDIFELLGMQYLEPVYR